MRGKEICFENGQDDKLKMVENGAFHLKETG